MSQPPPPWFDQDPSRLRFGWGPNGLRRLAPDAAVVVIVDVLSFSTSVDVALGRGAIILPYRWHDGSEAAYAEANGALLAQRGALDGELPPGYTLRPSSLTTIEAGTRLVLPSPNGSALTFGAAEAAQPDHDGSDSDGDGDSGSGGASDSQGDGHSSGDGVPGSSERSVLVGCLRNATAVGRAAAALANAAPGPSGAGGAVAVIAAGERWRGTTGPLRPAVEDLFGAGAILDAAASVLGEAERSPEAAAAVAAHRDAAPEIEARLLDCGSGRELVGRGFPADVELASDADVSTVVPTLAGAELISATDQLD